MTDHAAYIRRQSLLAELARLRPLATASEVAKRNCAAIEARRPVDKMTEDQLSDYVNLFARSVP